MSSFLPACFSVSCSITTALAEKHSAHTNKWLSFWASEPQPVHPPPLPAQEPHFEVVVLSVKTASADGKWTAAAARSASPSRDTTCQQTQLSAESTQQVHNEVGCSTAAHEALAVPAASRCASEVCTLLPEQQNIRQQQQQMAPAATHRHTKHFLAAKYSCATSSVESHPSLCTGSMSSSVQQRLLPAIPQSLLWH